LSSDRPLRRELTRHHRALRRALIARHALRAAAAIAVAIGAAVLLGLALPVSPASAALRLALVALAGLAALAWAVRRTALETPAFDRFLERAEGRFPGLRSWLRNALDVEARPPAHASSELASAVVAETSRRLAVVPLATLVPPLAARGPALAMVAVAATIAAAAFFAPDAARRAWITLWDPGRAAPPVTLLVEPGAVKLSPGASLAVRARVWGTAQRPRLLRDGEPTLEAVPEGAAGGERRWRFDLAQLTREQEYRVRVAGAESPRYRIAMAGDPQPLSFEVEYRAPAYARLPAQRGTTTRGDLAALRGTRARVEVTFDRDLSGLDATLPGGAPVRFEAVSPRRWRGEIVLEREGAWELHARAAAGESRNRYRLTPLADAPPILAVRRPEGDQDLPAGQQVALGISGQDDLGLTELRLEYRKQAADPWREVPLARFERQPREAEVDSRWDASALALVPGEKASFRLVLFDNNARGRGRTESPVFELRFPSLTELYDEIDRTQRGVLTDLERATERAREVQKTLEKLERQAAVRTPTPAARSAERSEEMRAAVERQQELGRQLDQAAEELRKSIESAAERQAYDQQLLEKLKEMAELMQQIQSPELRRALERMQQAMEQMDPRALEQQMPQLREENRQLLENLERALELLRALREEERLASLAKRAEELKRQQDELNRQHAQPPKGGESERQQESRQRAEAQSEAARQSEQLAQETRAMASELDAAEEREALEEAAEQLSEEAAEAQRQAAGQAQRQDAQGAQRSGQRASQSLEQAMQGMRKTVEQRQKSREGADLAAVRRSAQDLVSLQRAAEENMRQQGSNDERADRQTDLADGVARVADSLATLAERTPFLSPELGRSLGQAMRDLKDSGRQLGGGDRSQGEAKGRSGAQALNRAVLELRKTEQQMGQSGGQSAGGQQPMPQPGREQGPAERMGGLAERQSQVNRRTQDITRQLSEQLEMQAGDRAEMQRLAAEQQRIRQQLEQIARDEEAHRELLGRMDQLQRDMEAAEEVMRAGRADADLEEKQQRILSRMLDAQRSIHRRDFDPEREARRGEDVARRAPGELPAELLRESDRLRLDLMKIENDRYPPRYRAFIESYLRSLNSGGGAGAPVGPAGGTR
jgi:hypothetical protein